MIAALDPTRRRIIHRPTALLTCGLVAAMLLGQGCCALPMAACLLDRPTARPPVAAQVQAVLDRQAVAWNEGDIDGFMEGYWNSEALTFAGGGTVTRGWQATRDRYHARYTDRRAMGRLTFSELQITPLGDDTALVLGRWDLQREAEAGGPAGGMFTLVFRRLDGRWVIVHDHTSADEAPKDDE